MATNARPLDEAIEIARVEGEVARREEFCRLLTTSPADRRTAILSPEFDFLSEWQQHEIIESLKDADLLAVKTTTAAPKAAVAELAGQVERMAAAAGDGVTRREARRLPLRSFLSSLILLAAGAGAGVWAAPFGQHAGLIPIPVLSEEESQRLHWAARFIEPAAREAAEWAITDEGLWARRFVAWNGFLRGTCPNSRPDTKTGGRTCVAVVWDVK